MQMESNKFHPILNNSYRSPQHYNHNHRQEENMNISREYKKIMDDKIINVNIKKSDVYVED